MFAYPTSYVSLCNLGSMTYAFVICELTLRKISHIYIFKWEKPILKNLNKERGTSVWVSHTLWLGKASACLKLFFHPFYTTIAKGQSGSILW